MAINELDTDLATVGRPIDGGAVWVNFDENPTLPTDATTKMSTLEGWESLGELTEDGITRATSASSDKKKGWHGSTVLTTNSSTEKSYSFSMIEYGRGTCAKLAYGPGNVTVDAETGTWSKIEEAPNLPEIKCAFAFDILESNGYLDRKVVKRSSVTNPGEIAYKSGELLAVGVDLDVLDPGDGADVIHYRAKPASSGA